METKLKHTKEKWIYIKSNKSVVANGNNIAFTGSPRFVSEIRNEGESWLDMRHRTEPERMAIDEEQDANARLIASAPDLLKACMDLMDAFVHKENDKKGNKTRTDIFKNCPEFRDIAVSARHAIEKATQG